MEIADILDIWRGTTVVYASWSDCCINFSPWLAEYNLLVSLSLSWRGTRFRQLKLEEFLDTATTCFQQVCLVRRPWNYEVSVKVIGNYRFPSDSVRNEDPRSRPIVPTYLIIRLVFRFSIVSRIPQTEPTYRSLESARIIRVGISTRWIDIERIELPIGMVNGCVGT